MRNGTWGVLVATALLWGAGCGPAETSSPGDAAAEQQDSLTAGETSALVLMREEEKLARDVYLALEARWGQRVFGNIAGSEQQHMDQVAALLARYGLADPAAGRAPGEFQDPQLRVLYGQLVAQGEGSLAAALAVGATIEDLDISDLMHLSQETSKPDILRTFGNLTKGSRNHLRSFTGLLAAQGVTYAPQYLDEATYTAIVTSAMERGPAP